MSAKLEKFLTYGWAPDETLTDDENWMDLTMLITRSSNLRSGSMACLIVQPPSSETPDFLLDRLVSVGNNESFFSDTTSDIHAEIAALGSAARVGNATNHCTAFITMPPCRNCLVALYKAGIRRIVSRKPCKYDSDLLHKHDMEYVVHHDNRERVNLFVEQYKTNF